MIREETIRFSGLPLETAIARLHAAGMEPQIRFTRAPRGKERENAVARVICAQADGSVLTAAYFTEAAGQDKE